MSGRNGARAVRAEKEALLSEGQALLAEYERRHREDKLKYYKPHTRQAMFHQCPLRNRWALGGNRTGKTEVGAVECVYLARGCHPYRKVTRPMNGWVVSLSSEVQRDVAQKKLLSYINPAWIRGIRMREGRADDPEGGVIDTIQIESLCGGVSTIGFKSCAQGREKFQGVSLDFIWFDEEPPEDIYQECVMRVLDSGGCLFGTMTPLKGLTWVYNTIWLNEHNDPDVWVITMSWKDNPYLSPAEIARLERTLPPDELEARRDGRFISVNGLVYGEFDERIHVIDPFDIPPDWQDCLSIDPGLSNPLSCHWYAADDDGNVYVVAEHYRANLGIAAHMREIDRISRALNWKRDGTGRLAAIMDAAADQHTLQSEKSVAELFREQGLTVNTHVNKSKWAGIQRVKQYLEPRPHPDEAHWPIGKPRLFIFKTCPMMIREIKQYRWQEDSEEPVKRDDHAMDELRYYLMRRPELPPAHYTASRMAAYRRDIKEGRFCADCANLIKGFMWLDSDGKQRYASNGVPDTNADGLFKLAAVKGGIRTMPDLPGLIVRFPGHAGVYVGNGKVIEARGFAYGVVETDLTARPWTHWYRLPGLRYPDALTLTRTLKRGMAGGDVLEVQKALLGIGYLLPLFGADGQFGRETEAAVRAFQTDHGLEADGLFGPKSTAAMNALLNE